MDADRLIELIDKVKNGEATASDIREFDDFYELLEYKEGFLHHLDAFQKNRYSEILFDGIVKRIGDNKKEEYLRARKKRLSWVGTAASFLLCIGIMVGFYMSRNNKTLKREEATTTVAEGLPGDQPTLTLANGRKISLKETDAGILSSDNGVLIRKSEAGVLVYDNISGSSEESTLNIVEIPKGERYRVKLPDGTMVWLNAATVLRFPSSFAGDRREVELVGEAYFEVTTDLKKPFIVRAMHQKIEVLGTHFNVTSYADERSTKTTLVEGRVKIVHDGRSVILKPGQQASTEDHKEHISVSKVNTESVLAWKKGYFLFEDADIYYLMRHLARRYDIEVFYQGTPPDKRFGGSFPESAKLDDLLKYLESYGDIHFRIEGRRVTVMK